MLSTEETSLLLQQAKDGNDFAKEQLISCNSPLIKSVVKRYLNKGIDYDDLYQLGALGFVKAMNNYNPNYNVKFTTYAVPMIAGEIKRFLRDDGSIKISRSIKHNSVIIKNFLADYNKTHDKEPSIELIANALNIDKNDVVLALDANSNILSLTDKYHDDEDSLAIIDKVEDGFSVEKLTDKLALRDLIRNLSSREKQVIIMRYYLDKTQSEIAKELGISQVQVSRIENKVINELKNDLCL